MIHNKTFNVLSCLLVGAFFLTTKAYSAEQPNILLIISDDQGYGDFGFMGNTVLRTPQLDKLAASAAIFENYTTGVACSPGRAMLFTGRNHLSTGVWGVGARYGLRRDETLMPMFFRKNGYSTFYLGKGDCVAPHRMSPHYAGWQESLFVGGYQHHNGRLYHSPLAPLHSIKPVDVEGWTSEFMTQRGIEFMKEKKGSPWLLTMAYIIPHTPWKPVDERYAPYYRDKGCSENIAACFSHIEQMDTCVGQLLDVLKETGQDENTIVVFVSDNGQTGPSVNDPGAVEGWIDHPDWALRNVAGLRGNKSTAWENGTRVPLLVRMPGTIPAGMRTQFATAEDVLPTLLDVAGISPDSVAHKPFSGVSMRPALLDKKAKPEHPEVFRITSWGKHSLTGKEGYIPDPRAMKLDDYHAVLRGPQYKLEMYPGGKVELHDIISDKEERHDISKEHPEVARRMLAECRRQFRTLIDDGAFRFSTIYIGDPRSKKRGGYTYFDSASRIQSHTGDIRVIPKLTGFAKEGDSVTYTIDSAAAGMYAISLTGTFAEEAPLRVEVAGNVLLQQALNGNKLTFGTVNLPKGQFPLRLVAGKPKGEARAATVDDIFFEARRPVASKPLAEANRTLRKHADIDHSPVRLTNPKALADRVRGHVNSQPLRFPNQHWVRGAYYAGLMAMYESTSDRAYLDDCMKWGKRVSWRIKEQGGGPYESGAYPLVCGQIWYGCYQAKKDELMMQPTLTFLENPKVENPVSAPGKWYLENTGHRFVDGLFTAPPMLAMLYQMTGDEKYVDWMNACFWDVHKEIYDPDADLFYRDARSKSRKTKNGKKVLWSRGNGWAFGGLTRILKHLPEHHASYARYKALYIQMAESLAKRQQADGFWRSNLDDPEQYAMKESSGTGFFTYGITWGINNGILNKERFLPVARKAWTALASVVNEDGKVGWSQPAGGGPGKVAEADTSKFGTGIFLLAASEIHLLFANEGKKQ